MARRTPKKSVSLPLDELPLAGRLIDVDVTDEMEESFLAYSLSVITSRAIPDVRDGLKPVQRRILYGMSKMTLWPDKPHKKCARVTGDVMGRYHPHGDSAIYDALVRLAQDWVMQVPLVDGHGNFGSFDEPQAAARYTECRMTAPSQALVAELDEDTVDFSPSFDGDGREPTVLPAPFPNLLINGASGIAVGMATSIPPHNPTEVIDAAIAVLDDPSLDTKDLLKIVRGPDFPTGGSIVADGLADIYRTGRGTIKLRAKATVEQTSARRQGIVVTEVPYNVGPEKIIARIKDLVGNGRLVGVADVRDLTDRKHGLRLVIDCKTGTNPEAVLAELYAATPLEETVKVALLALVDRRPEQMSLRAMLGHYVDHRVTVTRRRCHHRLSKAQARAHIVDGLLIAVDVIDEVVATIRKSKTTKTAHTNLRKNFGLSDTQAEHILEMPLRRLTSTDVTRLREERVTLTATISELEALLGDEAALADLVRTELESARATVGRARRTKVLRRWPTLDVTVDDTGAPSVAVVDEPCVVRVTATGLVARYPVDANARKATVDDLVVGTVTTSTTATIRVFFADGTSRSLPASSLVETSGRDRGVPVTEVFPGVASVPVGIGVDGTDVPYGLFTASGVVKRVTAGDLDGRDDCEFVRLAERDVVVAVFPAPDDVDLVAVTSAGQLLRTPANKVRAQGRAAGGVAGIRVDDAKVIAATSVTGDETVWTVTDAGAVKATPVAEYPVKGRGGAGVRAMRFRKDELAVTAATVTAGPAAGQRARSVVVFDADEFTGRRDGSGTDTDGPFTTVGPLAP